jgi:hypothetical protein
MACPSWGLAKGRPAGRGMPADAAPNLGSAVEWVRARLDVSADVLT